MDYKKSGVDIEAGYKSVELMKEAVKSTMREEVLGGIGGFSGAFSLAKIKEMEEPVLLSGTDGCGTKVKLAFIMDKHDTIGIDAVAMCVNDVVCAGGEPLFFLDYIACGKNYPEKIATIVGGVAEGCRQSECALIGGETAEHPGLMPQDEYDLAGFAVGVVDKKDLITGENIKPGDTLIGIASSGVHSNGFSLVRSVFTMTEESLNTYYDSLGKTLGEALLAPTKIYVKTMKEIKKAGVKVKGCSHITGGGFYETAFQRCAVSGFGDGVNNGIRRGSAFYTHGIGQQADRTACDTLHFGNRLFHPGAAGGTAHAGDVVLFHKMASLKRVPHPDLLAKRCGMHLFHKLLQSCYQLVDHFVLSGTDIICHAGTDVVCQKFLVKGVQRRIDCCHLYQNIRTVSIPLHHSLNSANLSLDAVQAVNHILVFFL